MKTIHLAVTTSIAILTAMAVTMNVIAQTQFNEIPDSWFEPDTDALRQVPANIIVLRPTHFPDSYGKIRHYHENDSLARTVGRDATLRETIAEAYDCDPAQVILPPDATQGRFDFLVTASSHVRSHLREAIKDELHYTAHSETQSVDVLVMKVNDPALPGLAPSAADETSDIHYKDGTLYFTHEPVEIIVGGLSLGLNRLVLDQTGLTNTFDFSVKWNHDTHTRMEDGDWSVEGVRQVLGGWGLGLEPGNIVTNIYVVSHTQ
jgi:uncharacterized protein (TIGR03435 family)